METVLTIVLVIAAAVTGVLLLVRTNRDATKQEKRITLIIAAVFLVLLVVDRVCRSHPLPARDGRRRAELDDRRALRPKGERPGGTGYRHISAPVGNRCEPGCV